MNPADFSDEPMSPEQMHSALFANLVIQNTQMALLFLGKMPHPETGEIVHDPEAAQSYIAFLEMLETKTKGNLTRQEQALLNQGLSNLRMAFVKEVDRPAERPAPAPAPAAASAPVRPPQPEPAPARQPEVPAAVPADSATPEPARTITAPDAPPEIESRKRFTKKY